MSVSFRWTDNVQVRWTSQIQLHVQPQRVGGNGRAGTEVSLRFPRVRRSIPRIAAVPRSGVADCVEEYGRVETASRQKDTASDPSIAR